MMADAKDWDKRYNELRSAEKSDGRKLSAALKEAQAMSIKTPLMIAALGEMKKNSDWINESQKYFSSLNRQTLSMKTLEEIIARVSVIKNNLTAKQICD